MSTSLTDLKPVAANERIYSMDVLRGFALFGVFLVNIEAMVGPLAEALTGTNLSLRGPDLWVDAATYVLAQGKFYVLFSLLFGMGFALQRNRAAARGRRFAPTFLRRLFALLIIGLLHGLFVWSGDILAVYAVLGLVIWVLFGRTKQSRLPKWGLFLYLIPLGFVVCAGLLGSLSQLDPSAAQEFEKQIALQHEEMKEMAADERMAYGNGTYEQIVEQAGRDLRMIWSYLFMMGWQIAGIFLLGAWFTISGAMANPGLYPRIFKSLRWVSMPLGLATMATSAWILPANDGTRIDAVFALANVLSMLGSLMMAFGYLAWVVRGLEISGTARWLGLLAPVGRMALTNYLLQSIVCTLIFYNHGFGLYEQLPRFWQVPFVMVFFALQVIFSRAWMKRFYFGPAEWVWRAFTYLSLPPMRRLGSGSLPA